METYIYICNQFYEPMFHCSKFSRRCVGCNNPIVPKPGETVVKRFIVNGQDWHQDCYMSS